MKNNSLTDKIKESLKKTHREKHKSQREWTIAFKKTLYNLGKKNGYAVYPNKQKMEGEWLFDLCWANEGKNWQTDFKGLKLACEIEWSKNIDEIIYDFQKLTVIDTDIRLMIFQFNKEDEFNEFITAIETASNYTKIKGYNYLIAASGNNVNEIRLIDL